MEFYKRTLNPDCISFSSSKGKGIFKEALLSGHMECYFQIAAQFKTQEEPAFCGLSTLIIVLNALEIDPMRVWKGPWRWYHENMLDCCVPLDVVEKKGITMDQFACLAACNMLRVAMVRVDEDSSEDNFRELVKNVSKQCDQVLVVSYSRLTLGQTGDGHFSPVGGYHLEEDMVLIMDTARFKYPPHWVSLPTLFKAMQRKDKTTDMPRGYFLLSKNQFNPGLLFRLSFFFSPLGKDAELISFFKALEKQLAMKLEGSDLGGTAVTEMTLVEVLKLLGKIQNDAFLLTIQFNSTIFEEASYTRDAIKVISGLGSLPLYSILSKGTSQIDKEVMSRAGSLPDVGKPSEVGGLILSEELSSTLESLTPAHFLTVFMLSWPYDECQGQTHGSVLRQYVASQLALAGPELEKECGRIRQQLASIVGYVKKCSQISCSCQDVI